MAGVPFARLAFAQRHNRRSLARIPKAQACGQGRTTTETPMSLLLDIARGGGGQGHLDAGERMCKMHDGWAALVQCAMTLQPSALTQDDAKTH